jgi:2-polyprenyl-3-methyl-5-hydroxy-6-metoxy-1,4-benzoquinol methylase
MTTGSRTDSILNLLQSLNSLGQPNINLLRSAINDLQSLRLTSKANGYRIAKEAAKAIQAKQPSAPYPISISWKPSTQSDLESDWAIGWIRRLGATPIIHRKLWEHAFVLQILWQHGLLSEGKAGLGFGCGSEPLASYFASQGVKVLATDVSSTDPSASGWTDTGQHAAAIDAVFHEHLIDAETFQSLVSYRTVDMRSINSDLTDFDFCWSVCALEHLGSIQNGLCFVKDSLNTLKVGGVAVHTTEFNFLNDSETIDNWPTVLFQRKHLRELHKQLREAGHHVFEIDFDVGSAPLDQFIDVPPYHHDLSADELAFFGGDTPHLKLTIDGFASTCFGLVIKKGA